jgi:hypothetical protein
MTLFRLNVVKEAKSLKIEAATGLTNKLSGAYPVITFTSVNFFTIEQVTCLGQV